MEIAQAYADGIQDLLANRAYSPERVGFLDRVRSFAKRPRLGTKSEHRYYLLPLAIAGYRIRAGMPQDHAQDWPSFEDLTPQERDAATYLLQYIESDVDTQSDMLVERMWLIDYLVTLRDLGEPPLRVDKLPALDTAFSAKSCSPVTAAVEVVDKVIKRAPKKNAQPFEISTAEPAFMTWLHAQRDPKMWHQIVSGGLNWDVSSNVEAISWIIEQPECDPATAAGLFLRLNGQDIVGLPLAEMTGGWSQKILSEICAKSNHLAQRASRLSLTDFDLKNDQTKWALKLDQLYQERAIDGMSCVPSPSALFAKRYTGRRSVGWSVHSETFVQRDV